jgi:hypothetical protein
MPTVYQYAQPIQAILGSGGIVSVDNRISVLMSIRILDELRAAAVNEYYKAKLYIPEQLYQSTSLVFDDDYQTDDLITKCIYSYRAPGVVPFSTVHDGITYIGVRNGENLFRIKSQAALANYRNHYLTRPRVENSPWVLYIPEDSEIWFHKPFGGPTKSLIVRGVFSRPTEIPEYNLDNDEYPITDEIYNMVLSMAQNQFARPVATQAPDGISNAAEDTTMNPINSQNNIS